MDNFLFVYDVCLQWGLGGCVVFPPDFLLIRTHYNI